MFSKTIIIFLMLFGIFFILGNTALFSQQDIEYENFVSLLNDGKIKQASITDELIEGVYIKDGRKISFSTVYPHDESLYELLSIMRKKGVMIVPLKSKFILSEKGFMHNFTFFLPSLLIFAVLITILILNILIYRKLKISKKQDQ